MTARIERISTTGLDVPRAGPKEHSRSRTDLGAAARKAKPLGVWMERNGAPAQDLDRAAAETLNR
jgi:hypothetical protein